MKAQKGRTRFQGVRDTKTPCGDTVLVYGGKGDKKHVHGPDVGDVTRPKEAVGVDVEKARVRRARGGGGW